MYLFYILGCDPNELIRKVYVAQKIAKKTNKPSKSSQLSILKFLSPANIHEDHARNAKSNEHKTLKAHHTPLVIRPATSLDKSMGAQLSENHQPSQ